MSEQRQTDRRGEGKDGGRVGSCCLASFCFLTDTTKPFRREKTVVFVVGVSSPADAAGANRTWLNGGVTTATNPSSLCLPEREVKDGKRMKRRERRDEDKEKRDCVRHKKRLKGAENRENNPVISLLLFPAVVPTERSKKTIRSCSSCSEQPRSSDLNVEMTAGHDVTSWRPV